MPARLLDTLNANRDRVMLAIFVVVALVIATRLVTIMLIEAPVRSAEATEQRTTTAPIEAHRGTIYDRNGNVLATSVDAVTVYADPTMIANPAKTAQILTEELGGDYQTYLARVTAAGPEDTYAYIAQKADPAVKTRLQARFTAINCDLALAAGVDVAAAEKAGLLYSGLSESVVKTQNPLWGINYNNDSRREYPYGSIGAQVIGTVDTDNNGLSGIELAYDHLLSGTDGELTMERGENGTPIPGSTTVDVAAIDGEDIILAIDIDLQQYVEQQLLAMGEERETDNGNAIVVDGETGEIYAAASLPLYDPATITQEDIDKGATSLKCITQSFEPGSIFKAVTAAAALEHNVIAPEDTLFLPSSLNLDGYTVSDSEKRGDETMSFRQILARSSNVGMSLIEERIGNTGFHDYLAASGFGMPTHVDFPGESFGKLAPAADWSNIQASNISFGQGIQTSSLQVAGFYGAIANGGVHIQPHFLISQPKSGTVPTYVSTRLMSASTADTLSSMLRSVVTEGTGSKAAIEGYTVAGKTGTAEKAGDDGKYISGQYIVSFVGFIANSPNKLVCLTSMDNPIGADGNAPTGPMFANIMKFATSRYMITPNANNDIMDAGTQEPADENGGEEAGDPPSSEASTEDDVSTEGAA
jgi:cell division protein FtsI (penicillin-binding protein 3)